MRDGVRRALAIPGAFALLALVATWPLALHFRTHTPGAETWNGRYLFFETPLNLWDLWWFRHAVLDLHASPFRCPLIFHPLGADLTLHTLAPLHGLLGLFLLAFLSLAATQNLLLVANLAAAGSCAYAVARRLGLGPASSFLAGGVFAFSPGVFAHLYVGHTELLSLLWMPAALVLFLCLLPAPNVRDGVLLGLVLAGAGWTSPYYAIYAGELLVLAGLVFRKELGRDHVMPLAAAGATAGLLLSPLAAAALGARGVVSPNDFVDYAGSLTGFLRPAFMNPLLGPLAERLAGPFHGVPQETTVFVGFTTLALALLALRPGRPRAVRLGAVIAPFFLVLALGSRLKLGATTTSIPLPGALQEHLPLLGMIRAPGRHVVPAMLGLGLLAGAGWERIRSRPLRVLAAGLIAVEFLSVPLPLFSTGLAAVYHRLALAEGRFAVLELPFGLRDGVRVYGHPDVRQVFAQTLHGHPILTGVVSRMPDEAWARLTSPPVVYTLLQPDGPIPDWRRNAARDLREGPAWFARNGIGAIVVHPEARSGPEARYVEGVFPAARRETFDDGTLLLWLQDMKE